MPEKLPPPEPTVGDGLLAWSKVGLAIIPTANELLALVIQPPLERRRQEWMRTVGERLAELEKEGKVKLEALQDNEEFVSAVLQASAVALRTHQTEKLEALRNAIINVAKGQAPEDALLHMYLLLVDDLSVFQVRMMHAMAAPQVPPNMSTGGLNHVLEHTLPEARGKEAVYRQLWSDLAARGLVDGGLNVTMSGSGLATKRTTGLGDSFLKFISP